ncbi:nuclease-related domain-containing DEAD/DEAH box helicase [Exiguobacterium sp. s56]|uniref:NERD domain-containing protein n=1 Tax=Exiguobacterium sp. s56 TaxID=2751232 RepID=UPI001BE9F165|nr:nuclease-related domain-containing DEAD/DEAH box helicase [Exiguobacterium sp. s56]
MNKVTVKVIEDPNPRNPKTDGERYFLECIKHSPMLEGWTVYVQPILNGIHPDFILSHPRKGVVIVEVKDWDLTLECYREPGFLITDTNKKISKNPVLQVEGYKRALIENELLSVNKIQNDEGYGLIETLLYFHKSNEQPSLLFLKDRGRTKVWGRDSMELFKNGSIKKTSVPYAFIVKRTKFEVQLPNIVEELSQLLSISDYNFERQERIQLNSEQTKLITIKEGSIRRWSGVAGSGKTLVLAEKAAMAVRDGKKVLFLCFNITLVNYIRDLCRAQYVGDNAYLIKRNMNNNYFHGFLANLASEYEVPTREYYKDREVTEATRCIIEEISKKIEIIGGIENEYLFDVILIDEGQDFRAEWVHFLKKFRTSNSELLVMYDKDQRIYEDAGLWIEDSEEIKNIGFSGKPGNLKYTHRLSSPVIQVVESLRRQMTITNYEIIERNPTYQLSFSDLKTEWYNIPNELMIDKVIKVINDMKQDGISLEDITILTIEDKVGISMVKHFDKLNVRTSHTFDLTNHKNHGRKRYAKRSFQPGKNHLKISSYSSFKGWEASHIVLVLSPIEKMDWRNGLHNKDSEEFRILYNSLFISLTRVREGASLRQSFICINGIRYAEKLKFSFNIE